MSDLARVFLSYALMDVHSLLQIISIIGDGIPLPLAALLALGED